METGNHFPSRVPQTLMPIRRCRFAVRIPVGRRSARRAARRACLVGRDFLALGNDIVDIHCNNVLLDLTHRVDRSFDGTPTGEPASVGVRKTTVK